MAKILVSIVIGAVAGVIDILPMIFQKLDKYSTISAFFQWIVVSFVISHIQFGVNGWLKGLIIAELMAVPIVILVMKTDIKSIIPILALSAILGCLVGFFSDKLIK